ncbi:hypothetical protein J6590_103387, partial [Homalodisca vitripennis]
KRNMCDDIQKYIIAEDEPMAQGCNKLRWLCHKPQGLRLQTKAERNCSSFGCGICQICSDTCNDFLAELTDQPTEGPCLAQGIV